jgi:hypothetical protein
MIKPQLTSGQFRELAKKGYSSDISNLLLYIEGGEDINEICKDVPKLGNILQSLYRKGLVTDNHNLTIEGKEILSFLSTKGKKLAKSKPKDDNFDVWWSAYCPTDDFTYKGRHFPGSRSLRSKKDDCRIKLNKILGEGQYTLEEMVAALKLEINQKMENSIKEGTNKLKYMQNSMTYLNNYTYENYIELVRNGNKVKEEAIQTNETFI